MGGVMLMLPFCTTDSHLISQGTEIRLAYFAWDGESIRRSKNHFLHAALSTGLAFIAHAIICNLIAMPVDPLKYANHEIGFASWCVYSEWYTIHHAFPMYVEMTFGIAFSAGIWAVIGLATAVCTAPPI